MKTSHRAHDKQLNSVLLQSDSADSNNDAPTRESIVSPSQSTTVKTVRASFVVRLSQPEVAAIAYGIYLREGRPQGRDRQHWLAAESQLAAARSY